MKTFARPDFSVYFMSTKKTLSRLSQQDVQLLFSALPQEDHGHILIFQPANPNWVRATEHPLFSHQGDSLSAAEPFVFQRNVKAPAPYPTANPAANANFAGLNLKSNNATPPISTPISTPTPKPATASPKTSGSKNITLSLATTPPFLAIVTQIELPLVKLDRALPLKFGQQSKATMSCLNQHYTLIAKPESHEEPQLVHLSGAEDYSRFERLIATLRST